MLSHALCRVFRFCLLRSIISYYPIYLDTILIPKFYPCIYQIRWLKCCPEIASFEDPDDFTILTLVPLNPDIPCLCKHCRSRSKKPTDLNLHCLPLSIWIYSNNPDQVIWLAENRRGSGILIYSAGQGLNFVYSLIYLQIWYNKEYFMVTILVLQLHDLCVSTQPITGEYYFMSHLQWEVR